jgi:PleD family two-component response regulator
VASSTLGRAVDVGPGIVTPSASLGTPEALLADADRAMYGAKRGRGLRTDSFRIVS